MGPPDPPLRSGGSLAAARSQARGSRLRQGGQAAPAISLRAAALALLSRRDYTTHELRKKLLDRDHDAEAIESLIQDLAALRLIDDRRVAASHVRTATAIKGRGRLRVARELAARGVPKDLISEALAGVETQDEAAAIRKILTRKKWPANPSRADRRRMFQHLMRRGFPADAIARALGGAHDDED